MHVTTPPLRVAPRGEISVNPAIVYLGFGEIRGHAPRVGLAARRTHRTEDASRVVIDAVRGAEMDAEHVHLDKLMS